LAISDFRLGKSPPGGEQFAIGNPKSAIGRGHKKVPLSRDFYYFKKRRTYFFFLAAFFLGAAFFFAAFFFVAILFEFNV